ncbi:MAG: hypothetical protein R3338_15640, partial [Thermoanaerobaculia bacterium]|nr:hypothetical protein [Thermoanaerobaculia bacterium]
MPEDATPPPGERSEDRRWSVTSSSFSTIAILVAVVSIAALVSGNPLAAISRIAFPTLVAILLFLASIGVGATSLAGFRKLFGEGGETDDLSSLLIVGYPIFGGIEFLVALVSTHLAILLIPVIVFAIIGISTLGGKLARSSLLIPDLRSLIPDPRSLILTALLLTALAMSLLPSVSLDEVSYHLAIPKIWISEGSAASLPLMSHSYFPLGSESADLPAIAILGTDGAIASHLLHLFVAIALAILAIRWLADGRLGALGVAAIASTPALLLSAGWSGTDVPLVAVTLALFLFLDRFLRSGGGRAGIAAAVAAGLLVKYTFLPIAAVLIAAALLFAGSRKRKLLVTTLAGAALGSIFFIRNLILTGN